MLLALGVAPIFFGALGDLGDVGPRSVVMGSPMLLTGILYLLSDAAAEAPRSLGAKLHPESLHKAA
jgi:hypothetical protein